MTGRYENINRAWEILHRGNIEVTRVRAKRNFSCIKRWVCYYKVVLPCPFICNIELWLAYPYFTGRVYRCNVHTQGPSHISLNCSICFAAPCIYKMYAQCICVICSVFKYFTWRGDLKVNAYSAKIRLFRLRNNTPTCGNSTLTYC